MDKNADPLFTHYENVINWVKTIFGEKNIRKEMKVVDWGDLYQQHKNKKFDPLQLEEEVATLMADEDVTSKKGIYYYVLSDDEDREKHLNIRSFMDRDKRAAYEKQKGICANHEHPKCETKTKEIKPYEKAHADHKIPWSRGGKTVLDNCQILCSKCNLMFGSKIK